MEKRLVLAIALSLLVMLGWSVMVPKTQPNANKQFTSSAIHEKQILGPQELLSKPT
jgi:hypothetical protein